MIILHSLEDTEQLAQVVATYLSPPDVLTLEGVIGAGKTTFTQALARAYHVDDNVNSPTFTILKQYEGKVPFQHFDVYRLKDQYEDLGWDDLFYGDAISIVEWAQYIEDFLPEEYITLRFEVIDETTRHVICEAHGERFEKICEAIKDAMVRD